MFYCLTFLQPYIFKSGLFQGFNIIYLPNLKVQAEGLHVGYQPYSAMNF